MEHYCTLFDSRFIPQGLALLGSLASHGSPMHLWALCADHQAWSIVNEIGCSHVTPLRLADVERDDLLTAKKSRSTTEYYWTLTPALIDHVLAANPDMPRVTYVDADCFFFSDPGRILAELDESGRSVLITEHDFAPAHDQTATAGRFCVQFLTFANADASRAILQQWRSQCIEWCFARFEDGKFGDQGYLDAWPVAHPEEVHVLADTALTLAPWNVGKHADRLADACMYHFHGLRILARRQVRLFEGYSVAEEVVDRLYKPYTESLAEAFELIRVARPGWDVPAARRSLGAVASDIQLRLRGELRTGSIPVLSAVRGTRGCPADRGIR